MTLAAHIHTYICNAKFRRHTRCTQWLCSQLLALEGNMRYALVRVRESAESIAFYGGEKAEARMVGSKKQAGV